MTKPFTFFHHSATVADTAKSAANLTGQRVTLYNVDIQILSNPAYIGDRLNQELELSVGDIYSNPSPVKPIALSDIWFKNQTAGSDSKIVITGWY